MEGRVLAKGSCTGTYTLNPDLRQAMPKGPRKLQPLGNALPVSMLPYANTILYPKVNRPASY